ncbi:MAG: hypothetical protein JO016_11935 [Actinobacteria bacterium]|nr:hypothetical protein [Actinomycetota bacterium]
MSYAVPQVAPPAASAVAAGAARRDRDRAWALGIVLVAQAGLAARLVWTGGASPEEARCLRWAHWAAGLTAARLLALAIMLGVTGLLWTTTSRLYGRRAALLASGLFATLTGTQLTGSLATGDAPALLLLALAAWLAVRAAGARAAGARAPLPPVALLTGAGLVLAAAIWCYWQGAASRLVAGPDATVSAPSVLKAAYTQTSLVLVLAALGVALAARRRWSRGRAWRRPAVLLAAALIAPVVQAVQHSTAGLPGHVLAGAWFAAIAAGYGLARLSRVDRGYGWAVVMALPIAAATLFGSMGQAHTLHRAWPDAAQLTASASGGHDAGH